MSIPKEYLLDHICLITQMQSDQWRVQMAGVRCGLSQRAKMVVLIQPLFEGEIKGIALADSVTKIR